MSRTVKRRSVADGERPEIYAVGRVMLLDISEDAAYRPPADVHETPDGVVIRMELPGVSKEEVNVRVKGPRIEVYGEKRPDAAAGDASYLCLERAFGRFQRAFDVSGSVNLSLMTAVLKGGVLVLFLPKIKERRGQERRIRVVEEA